MMKRNLLLLVCSLSLTPSIAQDETGGRLVINELMQSNIDCVMDDQKEYPDSWIELYNAGNAAINLNRYQIGTTNKPQDAYSLPAKTISARRLVLVYCDKDGHDLHTPFRLETGSGCSIYLFKDSVLVDSVIGLPKQPAPNISYGRATNGSNEWGYQLSPTPLKSNTGGTCDHDHILGEPIFSTEGRVASGSSQTLTLTLSLPEGSPEGTVIRYTTNGTEPTKTSTAYTQPITINSNRVIRAKLFCTGWLSPRSTTHSFITHLRALTMPVISIVTDDSYLNNSQTGIFANNNSNNRVNWRRPINIEIFSDGEFIVNQLCETRVTGAQSRGASKKSMAIYANKRFGKKRFSHEFFPTQKPGLTEFKSLVLRNAGNDFDYLYMRDAIVQRNMAAHRPIDWQAWQPAIVYINGTYHGMLNIRERANENNVYTNYDGLEDIDLIENWIDLKEGTWDNFNRFKAFYSEEGHTMAEYEQWMDCSEFMDIMIMNLYYCNFDFPGNNIIMWRPREEGGRWRWIAKDADYTMGLYGDPYNYKILEWLYNSSYDQGKNWGANKDEYTLLFRRLMDDTDFRHEFIDRCTIYMGDFLNLEGTRLVWDPMYEEIKSEYPSHRQLVNAWWPNYNDELSKARTWLQKRTQEFYQQLADFYHLSTPVPLIITAPSATADLTFNGIQLSQGKFNGRFYAHRQLTLQGGLTDDGQQEVVGWRLQQTKSGSTTTKEVSGNLLSMSMPQCTKLTITPLLQDVSGIQTLASSTLNCHREGNQLIVTGLTTGSPVRLYDMRGILVYQGMASDQTIAIPIGHNSSMPYILHCGQQTMKVK